MTTLLRASRSLLLVLLLATAAHAAPRNVLLIIADDQGRDLGAYDNPVLRTPNLDGLAARGTLFTHAFATVSSCSPSRSVLYTGLYSHTNGMYGLAHDIHNVHLLPSVRTLPQMLKAAGYATALVGKKHVLPDDAFPFDAELAPEQPGNRDVAHMASEARKFIAASGDRPFLLIVGFSDPHRAAENFGNTREWPSVPRATYDAAAVIVPPHLPDTPEVRSDLAHYYESISRLDGGVGLFLEALRTTGREDDTLIIYLSDNGRPFPGAKTTLYDAGIHVPLIVSSPDQRERGVRSDAMVSWIDIVPTILAWTGASAPAGVRLPGRPLLPILEERLPSGWDRVYASHSFHEIQQYYPMRAVRTREFKYILNLAAALPFPIAGDVASSPTWRAIESRPALGLGARSLDAYLHRPTEELYDLTKDPHETRNVSSDPAYRAILERMRADLQAFRADTHDPWLPGTSSPFGHPAEPAAPSSNLAAAASLAAGRHDCAQCPEMIVIPAGVAIVGAGASDAFRRSDELPQRTFTLREPFAISRYEITRAQYDAFARATNRRVEGECLTDRNQRGNWVMDARTTFRDPGFVQQDDHPVACVSWDDAQAYVAWLNTQTNGGYRLPTEVEWEYVARAGASRNAAYPWGGDAAQGCTHANGFDQTTLAAYKGVDTSGYKTFDPMTCGDGWLNTAPVGSLAPNAFGVYDIIGNVSEWIEDCHSPSHDALSASGAPPRVEGACAQRIAKGGSWGTLAHNLRIAERFPYPTTHRDDSIGIRVVRTLH